MDKMALAAAQLDDNSMHCMFRIRETMCLCAAVIVEHMDANADG